MTFSSMTKSRRWTRSVSSRLIVSRKVVFEAENTSRVKCTGKLKSTPKLPTILLGSPVVPAQDGCDPPEFEFALVSFNGLRLPPCRLLTRVPNHGDRDMKLPLGYVRCKACSAFGTLYS